MGVLQHLKTKPFCVVSWKTVERSKNVLALLAKTEPRQLKSLGTDAFIASGSLWTGCIAIKVWGPVKKKLVAWFCNNFEFEFHGLNWYSLLHEKATTDLRSGKVTKIKLSALFRTLVKTRWQQSQSVRQCWFKWEKQIRLSRNYFYNRAWLQRRVWSWLRMNAGGVLNTCKSNEPSG